MDFKFKEMSPVDNYELTKKYNLKEFLYPNIHTDFELYGMHLRSVKESWMYPEHEHAKYEINIVLDGCQLFNVNGTHYTQNAGDIMFLKPGDVHSSSGKKGAGTFSYFCLHFHIDDKLFLPYIDLDSNNHYYHASSGFSRHVRPYLDRLIETCKTANLSLIEKMQIHSILFELLGVLASLFSKYKGDSDKATDRCAELAYKIADQIDKMVRQPCSDNENILKIEDIASELKISLSYCNKVFKSVYNMSPRQYLSFKKLNESKNLLANKEYSIEQISIMTGYYDVAHFSRQFKRWTGLTPSQYRKGNIYRPMKR
ncbi:AraC family transcriptional regulator [Halalkalibacter akibai]|uniref:Transcriptional regulator n=1 Tax=Halalkalibacter akibai (strain ATCC 43226 / DSM 21942 / CIP 109018 / JCM 9157 / 1139) TaxID=1236973 RepID=W4QQR3_HALA3|nr:AraC family transcriptional regulator [Halalkalibacter akibai]GAE33978.1 transcriptional regulator [Halalkalibacter akibai JCM 9157]